MASRLKELTKEKLESVTVELQELADRVAKVGNVIGPAFGAAWCDKALALEKKVFALKIAVEDEWHKRERLR